MNKLMQCDAAMTVATNVVTLLVLFMFSVVWLLVVDEEKHDVACCAYSPHPLLVVVKEV